MLHRGRGQCRLQANAADPNVSPRISRRTHGQEYHDAQGDQRSSGAKPSAGETSSPHQGQRWFCFHAWGPGGSQG